MMNEPCNLANSVLSHEGRNCETAREPQEVISLNHIRDIQIKQLSYGYIVTVGCNSFAFEKGNDLLKKLEEYIKFPDETEKRWIIEGKL